MIPMRRPQDVRPPVIRETLPASELVELSDDAELSDVSVTGQNWGDACAKSVHLETVRLTRTSLARVRLERPDLQDVLVTACDLSASALDTPTLTRVELHSCTLVGARWSDGRFTDVLFVDCQLELASFWAARFTRVTFERCKLREGDFHGADLEGGVIFKQCDLALTNWADAKLKGADVSASDISGIKVAAGAAVGLVVNRAQAVELAKIFGLVVV
jgi:uncharacterized protein YjbI with pentapeptide repeats